MLDKLSLIERIRHKIKNGKSSIGSWIQSPDPETAEIMAHSGYDWLAVDLEHGSISHHQLPNIFRAIELGGTLPIARVFDGSSVEIRRALDSGAGGVIIPNVTTSHQLKKSIDACRWPPNGIRGVGFCRANVYGEFFNDYQTIANAPIIVAMIENKAALDDISSIASTSAVDALFIGPYDLSASLGITGEFENKLFADALRKIWVACQHANMPLGIHVVSPDTSELQKILGDGYQFVAYSIDTVFLRNASKNPTQ